MASGCGVNQDAAAGGGSPGKRVLDKLSKFTGGGGGGGGAVAQTFEVNPVQSVHAANMDCPPS